MTRTGSRLRPRLTAAGAVAGALLGVAGCTTSGTGSPMSPTSSLPTSSRPAGSTAPAVPSGWARLTDARSGIGFALPARTQSNDAVVPSPDGGTCHRRTYHASVTAYLGVDVSVTDRCTAAVTDAAVDSYPNELVTEYRTSSGVGNAAVAGLRTSAPDGRRTVDFTIAYTQIGGVRQTAAWLVHAVRDRDALVVVQTVALPQDNGPVPPQPVRDAHTALVGSLVLR